MALNPPRARRGVGISNLHMRLACGIKPLLSPRICLSTPLSCDYIPLFPESIPSPPPTLTAPIPSSFPKGLLLSSNHLLIPYLSPHASMPYILILHILYHPFQTWGAFRVFHIHLPDKLMNKLGLKLRSIFLLVLSQSHQQWCTILLCLKPERGGGGEDGGKKG